MRTDHHGMPILGNDKSAHCYEIEWARGERPITVYAANRDHAARIAGRAGYEVRSVNMVG